MHSPRQPAKDKGPGVQWMLDGPELPIELLESHEEGNLVLFCGAGISVPAGLPNFKELAQEVHNSFPDRSPEIDCLIERNEYDRAFFQLEERFGPKIVRDKVRDRLKLKPGADLSTHEAILKLATDNERKLRLVTTNFDLDFEYCRQKSISIDSAPKLRVPKRERWNSLVCLHGRLNPDNPESETLVLSSADFGLAYLTEGWASRFVTELFRPFNVLFIGYSADDPVMRYMLDAFAADRAMQESVRDAFALVGAKPEEFKKVETDWKRKCVRPILYKVDETGHSRLHSTLKIWASRYADGLQGKVAIIREYAYAPTDPPAQQQVSWALRDDTGSAASTFADLEPPPSLDWLEYLESEGLFSMPSDCIRVAPTLCGAYRPADPPHHKISQSLTEWLSKYLTDRRLADWVLERGTYLHGFLRNLIRKRLRELSRDDVGSGLRRFWEIVSSEEYASSLYSLDTNFNNIYQIVDCLKNGEWNEVLRREITAALTPFLSLEKGWSGAIEENHKDYLSTFAKGKINLRAETPQCSRRLCSLPDYPRSSN